MSSTFSKPEAGKGGRISCWSHVQLAAPAPTVQDAVMLMGDNADDEAQGGSAGPIGEVPDGDATAFDDDDQQQQQQNDDEEDVNDEEEEEDSEPKPSPELLVELDAWQSATAKAFALRRLPTSVWPAFLVCRLVGIVSHLPPHVGLHYAKRVRDCLPGGNDQQQDPMSDMAELIRADMWLHTATDYTDCYLLSHQLMSLQRTANPAIRPLALVISICATLRAGQQSEACGLNSGGVNSQSWRTWRMDGELVTRRLEEAAKLAPASVATILTDILARHRAYHSATIMMDLEHAGQAAAAVSGGGVAASTGAPSETLRRLEDDCLGPLKMAAMRQLFPAEVISDSASGVDLAATASCNPAIPNAAAPAAAVQAPVGLPKLGEAGLAVALANPAGCANGNLGTSTVRIAERSYWFLRELGRGSYGTVSLVASPEGQLYALKDTKLAGGNEKELSMLRQLSNSGMVVQLYAHELRADRLLLLMELGDGDFNRFLEANPCLPLSGVAWYWEQMLLCVQALHSVGCVHMDLKPANFVLCSGRLKLIDLGAAHLLDQSSTSAMLQDEVFATLGFMAPETVAINPGEQPLFSRKSDTWSLGCILHVMLWNRTPLGHLRDFPSLVFQLRNGQNPVPLPEWLPHHRNVPSAGYLSVFASTLAGCLVRDRPARKNIDQLLAMIQERRDD